MVLGQSVHFSHLDVRALSLRQHTLYYWQTRGTDMMFHIPRLQIRRLEVHDSHLVGLSLK